MAGESCDASGAGDLMAGSVHWGSYARHHGLIHNVL